MSRYTFHIECYNSKQLKQPVFIYSIVILIFILPQRQHGKTVYTSGNSDEYYIFLRLL